MIVLVLVSACGRESSAPKGVEIRPLSPIVSREASNESCEDRAVGEVFLAEDGYNTCQCNAEGEALCTLIAVSE